jgi:predicted phosphodiesterase
LDLQKAFKEQLEADVKIANDADMVQGIDTADAVKVLVGDTKLCPKGSDTTYYSSAIAAIGNDDHIVMVFEDNTIVLAGKKDTGAKRAVKAFAKEYLGDEKKLKSNTPFSTTGKKPEVTSDDFSDFVPMIRFIVASDTHIRSKKGHYTEERLVNLFKYSYAYADSQDYKTVDAAVFAGDVTDEGSTEELTLLRDIIQSSARKETQVICAMGNHEYLKGSVSLFESILGQAADQHHVINGFHFISISTVGLGLDGYASKIDWLKAELDKAFQDNPKAPIFVFQHHHTKNTVYGSEETEGHYAPRLDDIYKNYPNIVNFSGHSHRPINNPRSIYQEKFTSIGTGALAYIAVNKGMTYGLPYGIGTLPPKATFVGQFYIVEADINNRVRIMPFNVITGNFFTRQIESKPDEQLIWYLTTPSDPDSFIYTRDRWTDSEAPYFDEDAVITANVTADGACAAFTFPQAHDDDCIYSYKLDLTREFYHFCYRISSDYYIDPMPTTITIPAIGIEKGKTYNVKVTAYDCYGIPCENPLTYKFTP